MNPEDVIAMSVRAGPAVHDPTTGRRLVWARAERGGRSWGLGERGTPEVRLNGGGSGSGRRTSSRGAGSDGYTTA